MAAAQTLNKTYNINVTVNLKRSKEEIDFSRSETDKLYNLISTQVETDWAKSRIERIHELIFLPDANQVAKDIQEKLKAADEEEEKKG